VALAAALAVTALWWQLAEHRARVAEARLVKASERIAALADSLRAGHRAAPAAGAIPASDLERLRRAGLHDPEREILADLARHPELIPFPGVEGGTMRFYSGQSRLVSGEWAYGYFEDGHVSGRGVFEFHVDRGGRIGWKRVAAKLD